MGLQDSLPPLPASCGVTPFFYTMALIINTSLCLNVLLGKSHGRYPSEQLCLQSVSYVPSTAGTQNEDGPLFFVSPYYS